MSDPAGSIRLSRPQIGMLTHVEAVLRRHPRVAAAWEAGWSLELACDSAAIWAVASAPGSEDATVARVETPRWWLPSRSGRALAIAEELATALEQGMAARG
ncbi:MAG TPA: hypothetical protein VFZ18_01420 [Longimicrobiaceae bacterium]